MKTEDGFLEGSGIGYGPEVTRGGALTRGSVTYNARPGVDGFLPPNRVTFEWVVGKPVGVDEDPDLCDCEVHAEGERVMRLGGWAEGFGALVGTHGVMHWIKEEVQDSD
ncbi:hypothetical protein FRB90_009042 [Tulasnella sp. 427]|nr:hypothetical protein FRB90_009042 [Tulasnella sp. 427]